MKVLDDLLPCINTLLQSDCLTVQKEAYNIFLKFTLFGPEMEMKTNISKIISLISEHSTRIFPDNKKILLEIMDNLLFYGVEIPSGRSVFSGQSSGAYNDKH